MADDFAYSRRSALLGWVQSMLQEYTGWSGRYASSFVVALDPLRHGLDALPWYRASLVLFMVATVGAAGIFLHALFGSALGRVPALVLALLWFDLYANAMPDIGEGFYWYTGAATYQLPLAALLLHAALMIEARAGRWWWRTPAAAALLFFAVGCNEVVLVLAFASYGVMVARSITSGARPSLRVRLMCGLVIVGGAIVILAPGNLARSAHFAEQHHLARSVVMSLVHALRFVGVWSSSTTLLALSGLFLLRRQWLRDRLGPGSSGFDVRPWMTTLALLAVVFLCVFPPYWTTGGHVPARVVNVACFFFFPLWFLNLAVWAEAYGSSWTWAEERPVLCVLIAAAGLGIMFPGNGANMDIAGGRAARFDAQLSARYTLMRAAARESGGVVPLPPIEDPPLTLHLLEVQRDPGFHQNRGYAAWFGLTHRGGVTLFEGIPTTR